MLPFFWYMLKAMICSGILFGYYWFFLRNKIFHQYNRFYLLAAMSLSLLLPLLKINFWQPAADTNQVITVLQAVSDGDEYMENIVLTSQRSNWSLEQLYPVVYILVSLILFFIMLRTLFLIRTLLKKYPVQRVEEVAFVNTEDDSTPFSFFKYIFWNSSIDLDTTTGRQIFKHEVAHIQEKHTHDKLFINIILIFCWCNPFFWLYRRELNMIHEFIADKKAVEDSDTSAFAAMILQAAYPKHRFELANNFFYSPIKRRLLMLTKNKNPRVNYFGRIMVLPLAVLIFAAFTFKAKTSSSIYHGKKITVVIDAGHGGQDAGAKSADGILEKDLTLAIAKKVKELNSNKAIEIVLVRDGDVYMSPHQKVTFAKSKKAGLLISFHIDNGPKKLTNTQTGMSVFVAKDEFINAAESKVLASAIVSEFSNNYGLAVKPQANQRQGAIIILQANYCPAVLIEAGFINNEKDLAYLKTSAAKETIAKNLLTAIEKYLVTKPAIKDITDTIPAPALGVAADKEPIKISYNGIEITDTKILKDGFVEFTLKNGKKIIMNQQEAFKRGLLPPPPPPPGSTAVNNNAVLNKMINALFVVDGEIKGKDFNVNEINPNDILSIDVLKGAAAIAKYGENGKEGVVAIKTKKKDNNVTLSADKAVITNNNKELVMTGNVNIDGDLSNTTIYVDDRLVTEKVFKTINPKHIESINIKTINTNDRKAMYVTLKKIAGPFIFWGIIAGGWLELEYFKKQKELKIAPGYTLEKATLWFSGPGFGNSVVKATINSNSLASVEKYIAQCEEGAKVVFDELVITDEKGNVMPILYPPIYIAGILNRNQDDMQPTPIGKTKTKDENLVFTKTEVNPEFTGGEDAWRKYLRENLKAITPVDEGWKAGKYVIIVKFIVHTDGTVSDVTTEDFIGSKTALHCIEVIKNAPKWQPAVQNGRKVNAYKKQPFTFVIEE